MSSWPSHLTCSACRFPARRLRLFQHLERDDVVVAWIAEVPKRALPLDEFTNDVGNFVPRLEAQNLLCLLEVYFIIPQILIVLDIEAEAGAGSPFNLAAHVVSDLAECVVTGRNI